MPTEIYVVKAGLTMTRGMVVKWFVEDGTDVKKGDPLCILETEEFNMEVEANTNGIVKHLAEPGIMMAPGEVVGYIFDKDETIPADLSGVPATKASGEAGLVEETDEISVAQRHTQTTGDHECLSPAPKRVPVNAMRRTIAKRMHESLQNTAQLTMDMEVVMDDAIKLRGELIDEWQQENIRPTYTDLVIRAVAKAIPNHPIINSEFKDTEIILYSEIHVGMAVSLTEGLVVPVIRNTDQLPLKQLSSESARLAAAARDGTLGLDDYAGGTFTVTALGMYGVDSFTPIINDPQTAILGVNRIYEGVAWVDDTPVKSSKMNLSLTWDHRVLDGTPAAEFLVEVKELLQAPYGLLV